jgi:hypothetical protein
MLVCVCVLVCVSVCVCVCVCVCIDIQYKPVKLYNHQRNAQVFLFISLFTSALKVSGFLQVHLQQALCAN